MNLLDDQNGTDADLFASAELEWPFSHPQNIVRFFFFLK